jgi:hypothetical protein
MCNPQRRKGERGNSGSLSALLAGAYTTTFLVDGNSEYATCCCVQARFSDKDTKKFFPCYGIFSAI